MNTACSPGRGKRRSFWWSRCRSTFSAKDRRITRNTFRPLTEDAAAPVVYTQEVVFPVGTWLSLVEHSLGVRGVGSSNLPVPTIKINHLQDYPTCIRLPKIRKDGYPRSPLPSFSRVSCSSFASGPFPYRSSPARTGPCTSITCTCWRPYSPARSSTTPTSSGTLFHPTRRTTRYCLV